MRVSYFLKSLRAKIVGGIVLLVLLVGGFVYFYFPSRQERQAYEARQEEAHRLAVVLSQSVVAGLEFEDKESVESSLAGAKTRDDLVRIEVLDGRGGVFYSYRRDGDLSGGEVLSAETPVLSRSSRIGILKLELSLEDLRRRGAANRQAVLFVSGIIVGMGVVFGLYLSRLVLLPLTQVNGIVRKIAEGEGDLTQRLSVDSGDEIGEFAGGFNDFLDKLHDLVSEVRASTERVGSSSAEISAISAQLATGAEEQTSQTSEVATSVQEMTASIIENSKNANQTANLAEQAGAKAREGSGVMQATRDGMEEIVVSVTKTGEIIESLSSRADQIGEIIQVIDEIADQTNLLALNAAIEAARAGEQGRGFAVVADEVRKLAERTTKATGEIAETIKAIQEDTKGASSSMEEAHEAVGRGKDATVKTEEVLGAIVDSVTQAMEMIRQIAVASEQMSSGAEEISHNVEAISTVTKESASGAEQMAGAAEELNQQAETLRDLVNKFKLRGAKVDAPSIRTETGTVGRRDRSPEEARKGIKQFARL